MRCSVAVRRCSLSAWKCVVTVRAAETAAREVAADCAAEGRAEGSQDGG